MTEKTFQPKGEDEIKREVKENYGIDEENEKEKFDRIVSDRLKDEEVKSNLHKQKHKNKQARRKYEDQLKGAGLLNDDQSSNEGGQQGSPENSGQNQEGGKYVTKEELREIQERQKFNYLKDEEYDLVKNEADRTGKDKEQVIKEHPVLKTYFENLDLEQRVKASTAPPSRKISPQKSEKLTDRQKELAQKFGNDPEEVYDNKS